MYIYVYLSIFLYMYMYKFPGRIRVRSLIFFISTNTVIALFRCKLPVALLKLVCCSVLQCVAVYCNVLQCDAM